MNLSSRAKILKVQDHTAAGTTGVTSDAVDTQGYEGVVFLTSFGTAASGNTMKAQSSEDDGAADAYADLTATSITSGTSDEDAWLDIYRPRERYLKVVVARGTSSTLESIWAILYNPRTVPVDNTTSGTIVGEQHTSPAEGTA